MTLRIDTPGRLAADQQVVFDLLSRRLSARGADAEYDALKASEQGRIISVDTARFLSPEFRSWTGRLRHTLSTRNPAGAYAHDRLLRELAREGRTSRRLIITAGGAVSGKTSQLRNQTSLADLVFDNQFKSLPRARAILRAAALHGWEVEVVYVHRPFADVVRAVIDRSQRTGRWNALAELPHAHAEAQRTIVGLWREFRETANIHAIYNASAGAARQPPGSRVLFKTFREGGPYHLSANEEAASIISSVLDKALAEGIVCRQVAWIIAKGLDWRPKR